MKESSRQVDVQFVYCRFMQDWIIAFREVKDDLFDFLGKDPASLTRLLGKGGCRMHQGEI